MAAIAGLSVYVKGLHVEGLSCLAKCGLQFIIERLAFIL